MATLEALRVMYREAKDALDYQIQTSGDLDDKAARIFRFDALVLTVVLTGVSLAATSEPIRNLTRPMTVYIVLGALALVVISSLCALVAYQTTELEVALSLEDMHEASSQELDEPTLYQEALETYSQKAYSVNERRLAAIATWFQISMLTLWAGLAVLLAAAFSVFSPVAAWVVLGVSAMGLIVVGRHVGLYG